MVQLAVTVALAAFLIGGVAAHGGSGNRNCQWGQWGGWGGCSSVFDPVSGTSTDGVRTRNRGVAIGAAGGGQPCRGPSQQRQGCKGCTLTQWTAFGQCSEGGSRTRTRALQSRGSNGPDCSSQLVLEDSSTCLHCKWEWGAFSECDGATKTRVIEVTQQPRNGGNPCPVNDDGTLLSETEICKHCRLSEWSTFDACTQKKQSRVRTVIATAVNGGKKCGDLKQTQECGDCEVSAWGVWSECSASGKQFRQQKILNQATGSGVKECQGSIDTRTCTPVGVECAYSTFKATSQCQNNAMTSTAEIDIAPQGSKSCVEKAEEEFTSSAVRLHTDCTTEAQGCKLVKIDSCTMPPEDCQVSEWGPWDDCEHKDQDGNVGFKKEQRRTRTVTKKELHNGKCDFTLLESKACPKNCEVSSWSPFGECDVKLLKKFRKREVVAKETEGGKCDFVLEDETDCAVDVTGVYVPEELADEDQDIVYMDVDANVEDWDTGAAAAAAAGGALSAGGLVYVYRRNIRRNNDDDDDDDEEDEEDEEDEDKSLAKSIEMAKLGDGWSESVDPNTGKTYYFHRERGTSTWNREEATF